METTTAPDITPGYPSEGERIAPAWQETWKAITPSWQRGIEIARAGAAASTVTPKTLMGLLSKAAKAGLIERKYVCSVKADGPKRAVWYRLPHAGSGRPESVAAGPR